MAYLLLDLLWHSEHASKEADYAAHRNVRRSHVTLRTPCMIVRCGSHTKWYVPFFNLSVHFVVPVPLTLVFLSTPGPVRVEVVDRRAVVDGDRVRAGLHALFVHRDREAGADGAGQGIRIHGRERRTRERKRREGRCQAS